MAQKRTSINSLDERITALEMKYDSGFEFIQEQFNEMKEGFSRLEKMHQRTFDKIDDFVGRVESTEDEQAVQGEQLRRLEERVEALEKTAGIPS